MRSAAASVDRIAFRTRSRPSPEPWAKRSTATRPKSTAGNGVGRVASCPSRELCVFGCDGRECVVADHAAALAVDAAVAACEAGDVVGRRR